MESAQLTVLFDGACNLCNGSVRFIARRDPRRRFRFATLQSEAGQEILRRLQLSPASLSSTLVLVEDGRAYIRSRAWLRIVRGLRGPWRGLYAFVIVPPLLRDFVYDAVAGHRYRIWGRRESCEVTDPEVRERLVR